MAAAPSPLVALSIVAVAMAGLAYVATGDPAPEERLTTVSRPETPAPVVPSPTKRPKPEKIEKVEPEVRKGEVFVEIYNNSGITGLAGDTAGRASGAGWKVVGSDNWVGTIPASTVYFPERLREAARLLARDLGIERTRIAVAPMRFDRLTVILTADYA